MRGRGAAKGKQTNTMASSPPPPSSPTPFGPGRLGAVGSFFALLYATPPFGGWLTEAGVLQEAAGG